MTIGRGLTMASVEELQAQLSQRDLTINAMREKTKSFVEKLNEDHAEEILSLKKSFKDEIDGKNSLIDELRSELEHLQERVQTEPDMTASANKEWVEGLRQQLEDQNTEIRALKDQWLESNLVNEQQEETVLGLRKEIAAMTQRCKRLEEERESIANSSADAMNLLASEREKITAESKDHSSRLQELVSDNDKLRSRLRETIDERDEAHDSRDELAIQLEESRQRNMKLKEQIESLERSSTRVAGEEAGALIAVKADLEAKVALLDLWRDENAELQSQIHDQETKIQGLERRCHDLAQQKEEVVSALRSKDDLLATMQKNIDEREFNGRLQLSQARQRAAEVANELESVRSLLMAKTADCEALRSASDSAGHTAVAIQEKYAALKVDHEKTNAALQAEIAQNQERKKKVREFVSSVTAEKVALEAAVKDWEARFAALQATNEKSGDLIENLQQQLSERELLLKENESIQSELRQEVDNLQKLVEAHTTGTAEQVQEVHKRLEQTSKELEGYRAKRMAARTEMIGMAQALEKAQKEGEGLKNYLQFSLAPLVFEQITYLEALVTAVELSFSQLSGKRTLKFQVAFSDVLQRVCLSQAQRKERASRQAESSLLAKSMDSSPRSSHSPSKGSSFSDRAGRRGASGQGGGAGVAAISAVADAHEQAEILRLELDRVKSGLTLLAQLMEKLQEVVKMDSRCCGGISEYLFTASVTESVSRSYRRGAGAGYDRVGGFMPDSLGGDEVRSGLSESQEKHIETSLSLPSFVSRARDKLAGGSNQQPTPPPASHFTIVDDDDE